MANEARQLNDGVALDRGGVIAAADDCCCGFGIYCDDNPSECTSSGCGFDGCTERPVSLRAIIAGITKCGTGGSCNCEDFTGTYICAYNNATQECLWDNTQSNVCETTRNFEIDVNLETTTCSGADYLWNADGRFATGSDFCILGRGTCSTPSDCNKYEEFELVLSNIITCSGSVEADKASGGTITVSLI